MTTQFVVDMNPDDIIERFFRRREAEFKRPLRIEVARPAGDDADDKGSGSRVIRLATFSPATRSSAAICSPTVAEMPGMVRLRRGPIFAVSMVPAWIRKPTAERGEACQCRTSSDTGKIASWPARGSRRMPEKKPEAALFGKPGRTQMVGRRMPTPSMKPRLE